MISQQTRDRIAYASLPTLLAVLDLAIRWKTVLSFTRAGWAWYFLSLLTSLVIFRGIEGLLHTLRHRGLKRSYGLALAAAATWYGANLMVSYAYFAANNGLPDMFALSYMRWETAHALVMVRDTFRWHQVFGLLLGIAIPGYMLNRACAIRERYWPLPPWGKILHVAAGLGLLLLCISRVEEHAQGFLPDVNLPSIFGRYAWKEVRHQNPPPIRLKPRHPMALPPSLPTPPMNILFILNESLRRQELQLFGYPRETTPRLKRFAQAHPDNFYLFRNAYSNSSGTLLSVPSIMTGISPLQPVEHRSEAPLLWEWAHAAGLKTFLISSQDLSWCAMDRFLKTPAPDFFWDKQNSGKDYFRDWGIDDTLTVDTALNHLETLARSNQRFVGVVHLNTNHYPYNTLPAFQRWKRTEQDKYDNTVQELDYHMDRILQALASLGRLKDTIIISTSDHGEAFEEHGFIAHFYCHYAETVSVPLWMYVPQEFMRSHSRRQLLSNQRAPVQNLDILPTLLDFMGYWDSSELAPYRTHLQGSSLLRPLPERDILATNCDEVLSSTVGLSLIRGRMHYLLRSGLNPPQEELYNLESDPWERQNLWKRCPNDQRWTYRNGFLAYPISRQTVHDALVRIPQK